MSSPAIAGQSQDEILSNTKAIAQGLEALKAEHQQILSGLEVSVETIKKENGDSRFVEQKVGIITKSIDSLDLGIGEAQVGRNPLLNAWVF